MAKQVIGVGALLNDGRGDSLRNGAQKINDNFTELYNTLGGLDGGQLSIVSSIQAGEGGPVLSSRSGDILLSIAKATETTFGSVKVGNGIIVTNGVLSVQEYTLPRAQSNILGGIKVGDRLSISPTGVLSADVQTPTIPVAGTLISGTVKVDGTSIKITAGVISVGGEMSSPIQFPLLTTLQRDALVQAQGTVIFNTSSTKLQVYDGDTWVNLH